MVDFGQVFGVGLHFGEGRLEQENLALEVPHHVMQVHLDLLLRVRSHVVPLAPQGIGRQLVLLLELELGHGLLVGEFFGYPRARPTYLRSCPGFSSRFR